MPISLRALAVVALTVVLSVAVAVYRTVARAPDSNQWVVHTQEVLTAIEAVLSTVVDAESGGNNLRETVTCVSNICTTSRISSSPPNTSGGWLRNMR